MVTARWSLGPAASSSTNAGSRFFFMNITMAAISLQLPFVTLCKARSYFTSKADAGPCALFNRKIALSWQTRDTFWLGTVLIIVLYLCSCTLLET